MSRAVLKIGDRVHVVELRSPKRDLGFGVISGFYLFFRNRALIIRLDQSPFSFDSILCLRHDIFGVIRNGSERII